MGHTGLCTRLRECKKCHFGSGSPESQLYLTCMPTWRRSAPGGRWVEPAISALTKKKPKKKKLSQYPTRDDCLSPTKPSSGEKHAWVCRKCARIKSFNSPPRVRGEAQAWGAEGTGERVTCCSAQPQSVFCRREIGFKEVKQNPEGRGCHWYKTCIKRSRGAVHVKAAKAKTCLWSPVFPERIIIVWILEILNPGGYL